jgi:hypothetical protein
MHVVQAHCNAFKDSNAFQHASWSRDIETWRIHELHKKPNLDRLETLALPKEFLDTPESRVIEFGTYLMFGDHLIDEPLLLFVAFDDVLKRPKLVGLWVLDSVQRACGALAKSSDHLISEDFLWVSHHSCRKLVFQRETLLKLKRRENRSGACGLGYIRREKDVII